LIGNGKKHLVPSWQPTVAKPAGGKHRPMEGTPKVRGFKKPAPRHFSGR
jgi:hypothetical protein